MRPLLPALLLACQTAPAPPQTADPALARTLAEPLLPMTRCERQPLPVLLPGAVLDVHDQPLVGAPLGIREQSWAPWRPVGRTDARGAFRLDLPEPGYVGMAWPLAVPRDGCVGVPEGFNIIVPGNAQARHNLPPFRFKAVERTCNVMLVVGWPDELDGPIELGVHAAGERLPALFRLDRPDTAEPLNFALPCGPIAIAAAGSGWASAPADEPDPVHPSCGEGGRGTLCIDMPAIKAYGLRFEPSATTRIEVVDPDGKPLEGARVDDGWTSAWTGADGIATLHHPPGRAPATVRAEAAGRTPAEGSGRLVLHPGHRVSVRCVGFPDAACPTLSTSCEPAEGGMAVPCEDDVDVCWCPSDQPSIVRGPRSVRVDPTDEIAWLDLRDGAGGVRGEVGTPCTVEAARRLPLATRLGLADHALAVRFDRCTADGRFVLPFLARGTWDLTISGPGSDQERVVEIGDDVVDLGRLGG